MRLGIPKALATGWILRRIYAGVLATLALCAGRDLDHPSYIAVLGGGGAERVETALALARLDPGVRLVLVGGPREVEFMRSLAEPALGGRVEALVVHPETTHACMAAIASRLEGAGIVVTHRSHGFRAALVWGLVSWRPAPAFELLAPGGPSPGDELAKTFGYALRY